MTPTEILDAARDLYNASGDTYFSDTQMYNWLWNGCHEMARKAWLIENIYTSTTVASQQGYSYPDYTLAIKRVTCDGRKLKRITGREDDSISLSNAATLTTGLPQYYTDFDNVIYLRAVPDDAYTLEIWSYDDHPVIAAASTILLPTLFHMDLVDYLLYRMFAKDKDITNSMAAKADWQQHVVDAVAFQRRKRRTDSFATVQSEDALPSTILGEV